MRIKAALYNAEHLEYGLVSIPFPIPQDAYSETVGMLEALDIGGPRARDCTVEEIEGSVPSLKCLEGRKINVDELDYLAKRLDSFTDGELAQFQGMAVKMGLNDMTDLINLTFCCQEATVITDFSDLEQIGRDHYMNLHGGCASMEELEQLDGAEIALLLISENEGTVTPYGVVYDNGMQLSQVYQGRNFPAYLYEDSLLAVTLRPIHADANDSQAVWLYLPTSELQIERMLCRDGMESEDFARLEIQANNLPAAIQTVCDLELESVFDLNAMCAAISTLTQADRLKFVEPQFQRRFPRDTAKHPARRLHTDSTTFPIARHRSFPPVSLCAYAHNIVLFYPKSNRIENDFRSGGGKRAPFHLSG